MSSSCEWQLAAQQGRQAMPILALASRDSNSLNILIILLQHKPNATACCVTKEVARHAAFFLFATIVSQKRPQTTDQALVKRAAPLKRRASRPFGVAPLAFNTACPRVDS